MSLLMQLHLACSPSSGSHILTEFFWRQSHVSSFLWTCILSYNIKDSCRGANSGWTTEYSPRPTFEIQSDLRCLHSQLSTNHPPDHPWCPARSVSLYHCVRSKGRVQHQVNILKKAVDWKPLQLDYRQKNKNNNNKNQSMREGRMTYKWSWSSMASTFEHMLFPQLICHSCSQNGFLFLSMFSVSTPNHVSLVQFFALGPKKLET